LDENAEEMEKQNNTIFALEEQVRKLTQSLESYRLPRQRVISTFKRDKFGDMAPAYTALYGLLPEVVGTLSNSCSNCQC